MSVQSEILASAQEQEMRTQAAKTLI